MKNKIKEYREKLSMSEQDLAKRISVHPSKIEAWEIELDSPSLDQALSLCRIFQISIDQLLGNNFETIHLNSLNNRQKQIIYDVFDSFINQNRK